MKNIILQFIISTLNLIVVILSGKKNINLSQNFYCVNISVMINNTEYE